MWNWVAKVLSPTQTAGREDGTTMSIGVSITLSAWAARNQGGQTNSLHFMSKQLDKNGGEIDGKVGDQSNNEN